MLDGFMSRLSTRVAPGQKVADNKREEQRKPFKISWNKTSAMIRQTIGITAVAGMKIENPALIGIKILFNNKEVIGSGESIELKGEHITAQWTVKAARSGAHTEGAYHAQITYNGSVMATTAAPLQIVSNVSNKDGFDYAKR